MKLHHRAASSPEVGKRMMQLAVIRFLSLALPAVISPLLPTPMAVSPPLSSTPPHSMMALTAPPLSSTAASLLAAPAQSEAPQEGTSARTRTADLGSVEASVLGGTFTQAMELGCSVQFLQGAASVMFIATREPGVQSLGLWAAAISLPVLAAFTWWKLCRYQQGRSSMAWMQEASAFFLTVVASPTWMWYLTLVLCYPGLHFDFKLKVNLLALFMGLKIAASFILKTIKSTTKQASAPASKAPRAP